MALQAEKQRLTVNPGKKCSIQVSEGDTRQYRENGRVNTCTCSIILISMVELICDNSSAGASWVKD